MRLDAFISVSLSLALLSPGHTLLAASSHTAHHTAVHGKTVSSPVARSSVKTATTKTKAGRQQVSAAKASHSRRKTAASARVTKTSTAHSRKGRNRSQTPAVRTAATSPTSSKRNATSQDFINAAGRRVNSQAQQAAVQTSRSNSGDRLAAASASDLDRSAATTQSATSVTRAASVNPRLESVEQEVATPVILPTLYNKRGRLIVPPPLRGSREILVRQNVMADRDGLDRIQDDNDLARMQAAHLLVRIPESNALSVDDRLSADRRSARPWTVQFLTALSRAHYARFHTPLIVTSAVRTVEFQQRLQRTNGNAAPAEGETASPHLTGQAIDLGKHGLSMTEIAWLRGYLMPLSQQGRIDVEEEFQQACFHISVYKRYMPSTPREIKASEHGGITALATGLR